jgi:K+-sensing histidine kinase KdpD
MDGASVGRKRQWWRLRARGRPHDAAVVAADKQRRQHAHERAMAQLGAAQWLVRAAVVLAVATSVVTLSVLAVYMHHLVTWRMIRTVAWQVLAVAAGCGLVYGIWRALASLAAYLLRVVTWHTVRQALASAADGGGLVYAILPTLAMLAFYLHTLVTWSVIRTIAWQVPVVAVGGGLVYGIWRLLLSLWGMHRDGLLF